MSGTQNPEFFYFMQTFALMRRHAPLYVGVAIVMLFIAKPQISALLITTFAGIVCGILQLAAAHFGKKGLYRMLFLALVIGLAALVYLRIGPFDVPLLQSASLGAIAVAFQRALCGYFHKYAFGGVSFSVGE